MYASKRNIPMFTPRQWNTTDFQSIVESPYFVDKTKFISTLLTLRYEAYVSAPPGFGKTSLLSMLQRFFEITAGGDGKKVPFLETKNYAIFSNSPKYLNRRLSIFIEDKKLFAEHFGRYPVVRLNFGRISVETGSAMIRSLAEETRTEIRRHSYLISSSKITTVEKEHMAIFLETGNEEIEDLPDIREMALSLVRSLKKHFDENVVLLIDNLDSPVTQLLIGDRPGSDLSIALMISILGEFTGALTKSSGIKLCFSTGKTNFAGILSRSTLHAFNIVHHSTFTNDELAPFFGLTGNDVVDIAERFNTLGELNDLQDWYGSHFVKDSVHDLYSTSSVIQWFENKNQFQPFLPKKFSKRTNQQLEGFFQFERLGVEMWETIQGHALEIVLLPRVEKSDIVALRATLEGKAVPTAITQSMLIQFVAENGLLTSMLFAEVGGHVRNGLSCPNTEARIASAEILWSSVKKKYRISQIDIQEYAKSLRGLTKNDQRTCETFVQNAGYLWKYFKHPYGEAEFSVGLIVSALKEGKRGRVESAEKSWLEAKNGIWSSASPFTGTIDCVLLIERSMKHEKMRTCYMIEVIFGEGSSVAALKKITDGDYVGVFEKSHPRLAARNLSFVLIGLHVEDDKSISASISFDRPG